MNDLIKQSELLVNCGKKFRTKKTNLSVNFPYNITKNLTLVIAEKNKTLYCFSYDDLIWYVSNGKTIETVDPDKLTPTSSYHVELAQRVYNSNDWVAEIQAIKEEL